MTIKLIYNIDAITAPLTGIGNYTLQLGLALQQQTAIESVKLFSANRWLPSLQQGEQSNQLLAWARQNIPFKYAALKAYHHYKNRHFERLSKGLSTDHLLHSPNFILMPFAGRSVVTFHDLSFIHYRATQPSYRLKYLDQQIPQTLQQADAMVVPSQFVKQEINQYYGYPLDKIFVTPLAAANIYKPHSQKQVQDCLAQWGLKYRHFILSVATTEPRKNIARLLQAYQQLPQQLKTHFPLVLSGSSGWKDGRLKSTIERLQRTGEIIHLGYVPNQQLAQLYASATVLALPSHYEGFGLPLLEAAASATPALTSQNSAMSEIAAPHSLLVNPQDTGQITEQLTKALNDSNWQQQAQQAALQHSQKFTWQNCAAKTINCYQNALRHQAD